MALSILSRNQTVVDGNFSRSMGGRHRDPRIDDNNPAKPWRDWFVLFAFGTDLWMGAKWRHGADCEAAMPLLSENPYYA